MGWWASLWSRVAASGWGVRQWRVGDLSQVAFQRRSWELNSIYLDNIVNKICTDIGSQIRFKDVRIVRNKDRADDFTWFEYSDLQNALSVSPNVLEGPTVFWSNVVRRMLESPDGMAVVIPETRTTGGRVSLVNLWLADSPAYDVRADGMVMVNATVGPRGDVFTVPIVDAWVFENPKKNLSAQLGRITLIIDDSLRAITERSKPSVRGLLKMPTRAATQDLVKRHQERMSAFTEAAKDGVSYLEQGEEFQELQHNYGATANTEELEFLKAQLYHAFGINEALFTSDYSEQQYRAYFQAVLKVFVRVIGEEINRKWFTQTARTQGRRVLTYIDVFDVASLKDLSDFAFRQVYSGTLSPNDVRAIIGMPPYEGGDLYQTNKNALPIGTAIATGADG